MDMIFTLKFTKGHNTVKTVDGFTVFVFSNCLMMLYDELGIFHANRTTKCLRNLGRTKSEGWSTEN